MTWIEVIQLRSVEANRGWVESKLRHLIATANRGENSPTVQAYCRVLVDSDFSIQVIHNTQKVPVGGSRLGLRLVNALKEFGLVNHSIWTALISR